MTGTQAAQAQESLKVSDPARLKAELNLEDPAALKAAAGEDQALDGKAAEVIAALTGTDVGDVGRQADLRHAVEQMGQEVQRKASEQSAMLKQPLKTMMRRSEEGGEVAKALIDLKIQVEDLDPARFDLAPGVLSRLAGLLPGVGTPLKRYFSRYESAQTVIAAIIESLERGRDGLKRDNITLGDDQKRMREMTVKLEKAVKLGRLIDAKLSDKLANEIPSDDPRHKFLQEEVLFALRQRVMDLQQQLAVNQQGVLAMEILIRNNKELIRGVGRALNVTVNALQVAVTVALALENQKIVLDKVTALGNTTDALIASTAARLKTQGAEIHKQAASTQLNLETLKTAFADINLAMADIASFRQQALPQMAGSILEMDRLTTSADEAIRKMEEGNRTQPKLSFDVG